MDKDKRIIIGSDHAAFELKEKIKDLLVGLDYEVEDAGTYSTTSVNYADFGKKVAKAVSDGTFDRGILLCGTGIGMSMQANRFKGVRAALCSDIFSVRMSRQHNDANILVMGGRVIGDILAFELVREWLDTPFEGGRHLDRILSLDEVG
ncbi:ribose 5-phosphate isomerase B [Desulfobacter hydrogenophilus]|uniref:Ribose 5-phosphate isomerase B n=1 Tax=Desulfobacter hydrogenophilus TaxID=2291 RepID=A0A328FFC1_9BACT|nr:ribose 5-phosphate isomerase B [Desulfobacter hydrogenophilus]NDY70516.1 ribose 5-phosphate isomerase B [Desulfobacter hydrogenophilus]QBH13892.1 ribose 5-phosphate isomerase B [Desulfobacter hydrogenophilus]RAM02122.1 ribose 5-phosphate isomerase B [Desulfobacter hydrogenophilus]